MARSRITLGSYDLVSSPADSGVATAQFNVGGLYFEGNAVEKDLNIAIEWYTKAAEQREELALIQLGHIYQKGLGLDIDLKWAFLLYLIAYKQRRMGFTSFGIHVQKRIGNSTRRFFGFSTVFGISDSPDTGTTVAQNSSYRSIAYFWLGRMTEQGEGTRRDFVGPQNAGTLVARRLENPAALTLLSD